MIATNTPGKLLKRLLHSFPTTGQAELDWSGLLGNTGYRRGGCITGYTRSTVGLLPAGGRRWRG